MKSFLMMFLGLALGAILTIFVHKGTSPAQITQETFEPISSERDEARREIVTPVINEFPREKQPAAERHKLEVQSIDRSSRRSTQNARVLAPTSPLYGASADEITESADYTGLTGGIEVPPVDL
jgi:hypothetical protein